MRHSFKLALIALVGLSLIGVLHAMQVRHHRQEQRIRLADTFSHLASALSVEMELRLHTIYSAGAFMAVSRELPDEPAFLDYVRHLQSASPPFRTLQYVDPNYVIRFTYPLEGNEKAIGLDLHTRPAFASAEHAVKTNTMVIAPVVRTVQGSDSIIARLPVFHQDEFRGLVAGVFDVADLSRHSGSQLPIEYGFRLVDGYGGVIGSRGQSFSTNFQPSSSVDLAINVASNVWHLQGWWELEPSPYVAREMVLIWGGGLGGLGLVMALVHLMYRHRQWLEREVQTRTAELHQRAGELDDALAKAQHEGRFRQRLLDSPLTMICVVDLEGNVFYWSHGAERITGYSVEEARTSSVWLRLYRPEAYDQIADRFRIALERDGHVEGMETTIIDRHGQEHIMSWYTSLLDPDNPTQYLMIGADQTANYRARELLAESEERFRLLFDHATVGLSLVLPDARFQRVNQHLCQVFGYTENELLGLKIWDVTYPKDPAIDPEVLKQMEDGDLAVARVEQRCIRKDGGHIWSDLAVSPYRNADGQLQHFVVAILDITRRKEQEFELKRIRTDLQNSIEQLTRTQQQIVRHERLRALGEMASGIAHDFNNHLTVISGFTELAQRMLVNPPPRVATYLERIRLASGDAAQTVARLREFYRVRETSEQVTALDLTTLTRESVDLTEPRWRDQAMAQGAEIVVVTELTEVAPFLGNASEIREVLTNLIMNAVDAMPTGGTLTLRTWTEGSRVLLSVRDTGKGMEPEVLRRCLEPFFTTKGPKGSGLGLAMVHGIMQRHGGTIEIESEPGAGVLLLLAFPVTQTFVETPSAPGPATEVQGLRILVAEDEPEIRMLLEDMLDMMTHRVTVTCDGQEALERFAIGQFDLVLTDRAMPRLSGDDLAKRLRQIDPALPIIMLTGFGRLMQDSADMPVGVDLVLAKPVHAEQLEAAIDRIVREKRRAFPPSRG